MSNKRKKYEKHPYSVRLQVVAKVLCEHLPLRTTGKMFDVNPRQVKYWVSLYSRYGEEGLRMQHRSIKYSKMYLKIIYLCKKLP